MSNPWEEISLNDYENHMSLDSVNQLQIMYSLFLDGSLNLYYTERLQIIRYLCSHTY